MQVLGIGWADTTFTLNGFEHDRGERFVMRFERRFERGEIAVVPGRTETDVRTLYEYLLRQHVAEQAVHAGNRIAYRHRAEGIAVIAPAQREQARTLRFSAHRAVLQRHLERHFHRHRTGVGEKHVVESGGRHVDQPFGQRRFYVDAPDGVVVEFFQTIPPDPAWMKANGF